MKPKITYIADLDQDIDDFLAILYLIKYDVLEFVVCDPWPITDEGKDRLEKVAHMGIPCFNKIQLGTRTVFCGGALTKVAEFLEAGNTLDTLVMNGGFVGNNIIVAEEQLPKFKYKEFVRTYNFNMDIESTKKVLSMPENKLGEIILVGKHLCHDEKNTIKGLWSSKFFKELQEEYKFNSDKRLHDVLACHEGLSLLNIIPDGTYCDYKKLYPMNKEDTWGSAINNKLWKENGATLYRKCQVAVYYK